MRIALAQINPTLGAFESNRRKILDFACRAKTLGAGLVVFPEHALVGYLPNDLLERPSVVVEQLEQFYQLEKEIPVGLALLVGCVSTVNSQSSQRESLSRKVLYNSAALIQRGKKTQFFHKQKLPTYDIFDEGRHYRPGEIKGNIVRLLGRRCLITVCEDIWGWEDGENPLLSISKRDVDLVLNLSASPFTIDKRKHRVSVLSKTARHLRAPVVYVNLVGGQDEVIFDGRSLVVGAAGAIKGELAAFAEDLAVFDLQSGRIDRRKQPKKTELLRRALVLGIRDFAVKTGIQKVHLGLSGGVDSALVACLAVDAVGKNNVSVVTLPGPFNDPRSRAVAERLAGNLGVRCLNFDIHLAYAELTKTIELALGPVPFGTMHENIQSRLRAVILMALANRESSLLLTTGNKAEIAVGYSTLYGDQCGGLAPIGDLSKAEVYQLAHAYNADRELIPNWILDRPPSAELRPNQTDQDSLPDYDLLDAAVKNIVESRKPAKTEVEKWLLGSTYRSEFKRWQSPPILKVKSHSFGRGRRMPIAHGAKR